MSDFTTTELRALADVFSDTAWDSGSAEPDARVDVLFDPSVSPGSGKCRFLVRHQHGWVWALDAQDAAAKRERLVPYTWKAITGELYDEGPLRLPTLDQLVDAGWTVEDTGEEPEGEEMSIATALLLDGLEIANRHEAITIAEAARAQTLLLGSIAASVHDLTAFWERELEHRRTARMLGSKVEEDGSPERESAHCSELSEMGTHRFPFAPIPESKPE